MKLKEKLAEEYEVQSFEHPEIDCYIAGFEQAREMAYQYFRMAWREKNPRCSLTTEVGIERTAGDLQNLGEEEVE